MTMDEEHEEKKERNIPRPQPVVQGRITRRMNAMKASPPAPG
eukprot:SAG11_NODE_21861_length_417_cov_0.566038_1_plen_41_part_01